MNIFNSKIGVFLGGLLMMVGSLWLSSSIVAVARSQMPSASVQIPSSAPASPNVDSSESTDSETDESASETSQNENANTPNIEMDAPSSAPEPKEPRDPFRAFNEPEKKAPPPGTPAQIGKSPVVSEDSLLASSVEDFRVVAIIWNTGRPRALVQDKKNVISKIERLTKIGRNNGFVAEIREGEVVIVEPVIQGTEVGAVTKILAMGAK